MRIEQEGSRRSEEDCFGIIVYQGAVPHQRHGWLDADPSEYFVRFKSFKEDLCRSRLKSHGT